MLEVGTVVGWMEEWYPPAQKEHWDQVGLICGNRSHPVSRILLAVDPVAAVAAQAVAEKAQLVITHHPLYLRGTSFVSEDDYKGRLVSELIRSDVALYNAHTNADSAQCGVASALAETVGLISSVPMQPTESDPDVGLGRIGVLSEEMTLRQYARYVAQKLPAGPSGLLVAGDPERMISTVAVSGGAGDGFLGLAAQLGADVYVTADLRHHPASESIEEGGPALICGSHWATEWPWLPVLAHRLTRRATLDGQALEVIVSETCTEPWFEHLPTGGETK